MVCVRGREGVTSNIGGGGETEREGGGIRVSDSATTGGVFTDDAAECGGIRAAAAVSVL